MGETKRREEAEYDQLVEINRVIDNLTKALHAHRHDYPAFEAAIKSFKEHRHEGVEDAARRLEILETWRAAYTLRTADKLEELEENTFQTDQAMRLCRLLRRDLTGVLERVAKLEKAPVPTQVPGQYKEAIFMMQGHHFNGPLVCASCKRSLDSSYCGGTWQVDRCVCEGKP